MSTAESCLADDLEGKVDTAPPRVQAALHPEAKRFLENKQLVQELVRGFGSPLNIIFPEHIEENIVGFQKIMADRSLSGRYFFFAARLLLRRRAGRPGSVSSGTPNSSRAAASCLLNRF